MSKITSGQAIEALTALREIARIGFPRGHNRAAAKVSRMIINLSRDATVLSVDDQRVKLCEQHGEKQPDGSIRVHPARMPAFNADYAPLAAEMIDTEIEPLPISTFDAIDGIHPEWLVQLGSLVNYEDDTAPKAQQEK